MPSLSVIMPAYNASKSIRNAINSVLNQDHRNLQLWVVDDGSDDDTCKIVEELRSGDSRVRLIKQNNSGPYKARINALMQIDTDYFGFVDSDDVINPEMYSTLIDYAEKNDLDVVRCDICGEETLNPPEYIRGREKIFEKFVLPKLVEGRGNALITDKVYKLKCRPRDFIKLNSRSFEDVVMNMQLFLAVQAYGYVHKGYYRYINNPQSTTHVFRGSDLDGLAEVMGKRRMLLDRFDKTYSDHDYSKWAIVNGENLLKKILYSTKLTVEDQRNYISRLLHIIEEEGYEYKSLIFAARWPTVLAYTFRLRIAIGRFVRDLLRS